MYVPSTSSMHWYDTSSEGNTSLVALSWITFPVATEKHVMPGYLYMTASLHVYT